MAVNYTNTLSTDLLISEISAMLEWRDDLLRRALYPAAMPAAYARPESQLLAWCRKESERSGIDGKIISRLQLVFDDLMRLGDDVAGLNAGVLPPEVFDRLSQQFNAYIDQVRRLHQDMADSAGAVDMLTGLRTVAGLRTELKREQDRFDRKGAPFSIASIEIDHLDRLQQAHDRRTVEAIFAGVAQTIGMAIRSFDDA
jgi:GGDEF domain-containing protein